MQVFFQCINSAISYFPLQRIIYLTMHSPEEIHLFSPCISTHRFSFFSCTNSVFPLNQLFSHAHIHLFPHAQIQVFFQCINSAIFPIQRYSFFFYLHILWQSDIWSWSFSYAQIQLLSVTSHINCIVARCLINVVYLTACCLYQVMMTLHFLNDVANGAESTQTSDITS